MSIANVHPDQHHLAGVIAGGKQLMYFVNDGGVYRALDGYTGLLTGTCGGQNHFDDLNGTLGSMTQFVSFSMHPTDANTILGGTQDNGSPATGTATTSTSWANVLGGDGGFNAISPTVTTDWYTANPDLPPNSLNINYCGSGIGCTNNAFQQVVSSAQVGGDDGAFYFPYILDPQASSQLIAGTCRVWRGGPATSSAGTYTALSDNFDNGVGGSGGICNGLEINTVRSLAAGGPKDANGYSKVVYAGTDGSGGATNPPGGRVFVTTNAGTSLMVDRTGTINPGEFPVSSIAIDPSDATGQTAYVTIMGFHVGHVFKTTNAGLTWTDFSGASPNNIPDAPADAVVVDASAGMVYVGTDVGVLVSATSAASWTELGPPATVTGAGYLPNVPVTALRMFNSGGKRLLRASTYGRGIWQFDLLASTAPDYEIAIPNSTLTVFPTQTATFSGELLAVNGYGNAVSLSCAAGTTAPPTTCTPSPASRTPTGIGASFSVSAAGAIGDYIFNVHGVGTDAGTITHDAPVTLHVVDFMLGAPSPASVSVGQGSTSGGIAFVVSGAGSFNGSVTLSCPASGMPAGVSCSFSPSASVSALPATVTLTFTAGPSTPIATTAITISASTSGAPAPKMQSVSLTVTAPVPDYMLSISNSPQSAGANQTATLNGVLQALHGYSSVVNLSCGSGAPPTCMIAPASITPTTAGAAFTVTVSSGTAQSYNFAINGAGTDAAHVSHTSLVTFNSLFTVTLADSSGTQTVKAGQTATYSVVVSPVGATSFLSAVSFACAGLPAGASCSGPTIPVGTSGTQTVTMAIGTAGPGTALIRPSAQNRGTLFWLGVPALGMVIGGWARRPATRRSTAALASGLVVSALLQISCGGSGNSGGGGGGGTGAVVVSVSPHSASKFPTEQQQFTASVSGTSNTQVTWQVNGATGGSPSVGTVDSAGLYTTPVVVPTPNVPVMVSAISQADVTKSDTAMVTIKEPTRPGKYPFTITAAVGSLTASTTATLVVE